MKLQLAVTFLITGFLSLSMTGCICGEMPDKVKVSPGAVSVEGENGETVNVSGGEVHVEGADGEKVDISGGTVHVEGSDGEIVDVKPEGVFVDGVEGDTVEVTDDKVHIQGEDLKELPEDWPDEITVPTDFRVTDIYVISGDDPREEIIAVGRGKIIEISELYESMPGWVVDEDEHDSYKITDEYVFLPLTNGVDRLWVTLEATDDNQLMLILDYYDD